MVERGLLGHSRKKGFFMKRKNDIWKRWWLRLAYFNLVLLLHRNHLMDLLHKSVDWFLYNGNTGQNGKVDAWVRYILMFR